MSTNSSLSNFINQKTNEPFLSIFNQFHNTLFWVKDTNLTIVKINSTFAHYLNLNENEIIGKTDLELYPKELATNYTLDDRHIIQTGQAIKDRIELLINRFGAVEWRKVTKLPIFDEDQTIIGTTGISRPFDNANEDIPYEYKTFNAIINHASDYLKDNITVKGLANFAGVSESTLNRRFQEYLQITPQQFLSQLRVTKACQLLTDSVLNISEIADKCGYESPAAFSRAFKKLKHISPREYRK